MKFSLGEELGSGTYSRDISQWVLGYIVGVEWEDNIVAFTNHMQSDKKSYNRKYMYTTEDATLFEATLAQVGDKFTEYETRAYKKQRLADFYISGDNIEIRLPWSLLNPSEMEIHDDYYENYGIEGVKISEIYVGAGIMGVDGQVIPMSPVEMKGWGRKPSYHERMKQGYYDLQKLWKESKALEK